MTDKFVLDKAFHYVLSYMVEHGIAPHYTDLAIFLACSTEDGRQIIHEMLYPLTPGWVHPGTDWIACVTPLASIPTQYRITVDGQQKWHAQ